MQNVINISPIVNRLQISLQIITIFNCFDLSVLSEKLIILVVALLNNFL